ncbi:helix-turn-helix domain-containing protein [Paenibacillus sp. P26]|nr:helix-turn-helix domain-containing protein [Paenibacillus sp. P26]
MRRRRPGGESAVKFVIVSGYGEFDYAKRAMELGIRHYLLKPLIAEEAEASLRGIALELEAESVLRQIREVADEEEAAERFDFEDIRHAYRILDALESLDEERLKAETDAAERAIQEKRLAPELVKMIVIHVAYRCLGLIREMNGDPGSLLEKYNITALEGRELGLADMLHLLRGFCTDGPQELRTLQRDQSRGIIHEINAYIRNHYSESLTLKGLAEKFYIHPVYLGQLFARKNGISFNEYLHDLRIAEAQRLLRETDLRSYQIAEQVGYVSYDKFLKQFEKRLGMKPNEYKATR